ncbi:MAG: hypothetical protein U0R44_03390 [Candidatus Micrarchaeia archaeon]
MRARAKAQGDRSNVVSLDEFRRKHMDSETDWKAECLERLNKIAPVDDGFIAMLGLPENLQRLGEDHFSTDPENGLYPVEGAINFGYPFPSSVPDFGILLSTKGSDLFCTLLDRKRKIIVSAPVRNANAASGSWSGFREALRAALSRAGELSSAGTSFTFVVESESSSVID